MKLNRKEQRTLIIEIGMQNAAQSIAIASSPFIFNNDIIAIPAIIYDDEYNSISICGNSEAEITQTCKLK